MATSNSKNYSITATDIIDAALRKTGEYDIGETINADETSAALLALNLMVKAWAARGIGIWLRQENTLFLNKGTQKYLLGTAHMTADTIVETTLNTDEASGQTAIDVVSTTGFAANDFVVIMLDDGESHLTTLNTLLTFEVADALPSAASAGNRVYGFTNKATRPQRIKYAFRRDTSDHDTEVDIIGESEYFQLSNKAATGPVNQIWYQPTLDNGSLYVWPVHSDSVDKLILICDYLPDDFDATANNPEFPIEWGETLVYNLADRLAPESGLPRLERRELKIEAREMLEAMLDYDVEHASVRFVFEP